MPSVFAYGTLRDPDVLKLVLGRAVDPTAIAPATAPGYRAVFFPRRTYPALIRDSAATATGTLLTNLAPADLALLDLFEGEEYARTSIEIIVSGQKATADVYWPAQPISPDAPAWHLADWTARHKAAFLGVEADNLIELRRRLTDLPH